MSAPTRDLARLVRERLADPSPLNFRPAAPGVVFGQLEDAPPPGGERPIRASNLGGCARQLAYKLRGAPETGKQVDDRSRMAFAFGDFAEAFLTVALANALDEEGRGWSLEAYTQGGGDGQLSCVLELPGGLEVPGHPDGLIVSPGRRFVLEVKSGSSYATATWAKAIKAGKPPWTPDDAYWWQGQAYMHALDVEAEYILAVGKDSGTIQGWWLERDESFPGRAAEHVASARGALFVEDVPRRLAGGQYLRPSTNPKARGELPWQCRYCPFWRSCWPSAEESVKRDWRGLYSRTLWVRE